MKDNKIEEILKEFDDEIEWLKQFSNPNGKGYHDGSLEKAESKASICVTKAYQQGKKDANLKKLVFAIEKNAKNNFMKETEILPVDQVRKQLLDEIIDDLEKNSEFAGLFGEKIEKVKKEINGVFIEYLKTKY